MKIKVTKMLREKGLVHLAQDSYTSLIRYNKYFEFLFLFSLETNFRKVREKQRSPQRNIWPTQLGSKQNFKMNSNCK